MEDVDPDPGAGGDEGPLPDGGGEPGPSTACWLGEMGDGFTCHDASALRDHAQARCARMGAELASFLSDTLNPSCAEHETSQVFFECCGAEPPPPPPPGACWKGELGDGSSCIDLSALKDRAYAMCDSANAVLATFDVTPDPRRCGDNAAIMAYFECCGAEPPPPPSACWSDQLGDGSSCIDLSALKDRAYATCDSANAVLTRLDYKQDPWRCGDNAAIVAYFECCGAEPPPPPPPPPGACFKGELGDGRSCVDPSALKDRAYATCVSAGANLTVFDYERGASHCAPYETTRAVFECCGAPPPPPPGACFKGELGDGRSCVDPSALKDRAYATCVSAGANLTVFDYERGASHCAPYETTRAVFECCGTPPPPPPPPDACFKGELGDGRSCLDPSVLKDRAYRTCVSAGANLTVFDYEQGASHCAPYETTRAVFECCGTPPPPPPPPPGPCFKGELGDGRSCLDPSVLKDRAYRTCVSAGANLTVFDYEQGASHCASYETTRAVFECCGTPPPPPPERCWGGELDGGSSCIDLSALKERAAVMCASDNAQLTQFDYANNGRCADHEATHAKFACCAPTAPPPR